MKNSNAIINSDYGSIIININDTVIAKYISQEGYWAVGDINLIKELIDFQLTKKDGVVFYDVGANIGTHSLAVAKSFGEKVKVRAFEAQRQVFNMLCGTVAINGINNIYCHNLAVSDVCGVELEIELPDYHSNNNFGGLELIKPQRSDNGEMVKGSSEIVSTVTLDSFKEKVDFIKMDIEGMEDRAIMGASVLIDEHRPICFIEILKTDFNYLFNFFKNKNYLGFQKNADLIVIPLEYQIQVNGLNRIF